VYGAAHVPPTCFRIANAGGLAMMGALLWLLIIAIGVYLLIAMMRPEKF
jgi:K+-transporting ATPase KdpF subunit